MLASLSPHVRGLVVTTIGVLVLTPDTLLIRLADTSHWTLLFWRGVLNAAILALVMLGLRGRNVANSFRAIGRKGLLAAALHAVGMLCFVASLSYTKVANTLIILAAVPLCAALLSATILREPVALRTWGAIAASCIGIGLLVGESWGAVSFVGNLVALGAAFCLGATFTTVRHGRAVNMIPAVSVSGAMVAAVTVWLAPSLVIPWDRLIYVLLMGLVVAAAFAMLVLGTRDLPAPEVSLLMLLETVLGPLWVWLVVNEAPSRLTLLGGAVVVATLIVHSYLSLRGRARSESRATC